MKSIYELRLEVEIAIANEYEKWVRDHMRQIVESTGFERAEIFLVEQTNPAVKVWIVHYLAPDRAAIEDYLNVHSKSFRADGVTRFGTKVKIERRIMIFQESFPA